MKSVSKQRKLSSLLSKGFIIIVLTCKVMPKRHEKSGAINYFFRPQELSAKEHEGQRVVP